MRRDGTAPQSWYSRSRPATWARAGRMPRPLSKEVISGSLTRRAIPPSSDRLNAETPRLPVPGPAPKTQSLNGLSSVNDMS